MVAIDLDLIPGNEILVRRESYFAHIDRNIPISISASFGGSFQNLLFGTGLMTRIKGNGIVFVLSSGSMIPVKLNSGEKVSVDLDNLLMCTNSTVPIVEFKGFKNMFFGHEGLVLSFFGPGEIYVNTHDVDSYIKRIATKVFRELQQDRRQEVSFF